MTDEEREAIQRRLDATTAGPWENVDDDSIWTASGWLMEVSGEGNAEFVAHAREDMRALLAENAALRAQLATAQRREAEARAIVATVDILQHALLRDTQTQGLRYALYARDADNVNLKHLQDAARAWLAAGATAAGDGGEGEDDDESPAISAARVRRVQESILLEMEIRADRDGEDVS